VAVHRMRSTWKRRASWSEPRQRVDRASDRLGTQAVAWNDPRPIWTTSRSRSTTSNEVPLVASATTMWIELVPMSMAAMRNGSLLDDGRILATLSTGRHDSAMRKNQSAFEEDSARTMPPVIPLADIRVAATRFEGRRPSHPAARTSRTLAERLGRAGRAHSASASRRRAPSKRAGALQQECSRLSGSGPRRADWSRSRPATTPRRWPWAARVVEHPCAGGHARGRATRAKLEAVRGYWRRRHPPWRPQRTLFDRLHQVEREAGTDVRASLRRSGGPRGAGTVGLEIVETRVSATRWCVPVGGGGSMGGVTSRGQRNAGRVRDGGGGARGRSRVWARLVAGKAGSRSSTAPVRSPMA
jgi:hypothetical protein